MCASTIQNEQCIVREKEKKNFHHSSPLVAVHCPSLFVLAHNLNSRDSCFRQRIWVVVFCILPMDELIIMPRVDLNILTPPNCKAFGGYKASLVKICFFVGDLNHFNLLFKVMF